MRSGYGRDNTNDLYAFIYYGAKPSVGVEYDPDKVSALHDLNDWFLQAGQTPNVFYTQLTKDQQARYKFRPKLDQAILKYMPDEATHIVWSLYLSIIPKRIAERICALLPASDFCNKDRLSELAGIFKKNQHLLDDHWEYFVDLQTLGDFVAAPSSETIEEKIRAWVSEDVPHSLPDFDFYELYFQGCLSFLYNFSKPAIRIPLTPVEWLADPMHWATSGSSDAKRLLSRDKTKAQKSKWATALAINPVELLLLFYDPKYQVLTTTPKRELGKPRMVISGDMSNYLRQGYIAYWLDDVLRGHPHTTLYYNKQQMLTMWTQMIQNTVPLGHDTQTKNMTLDESKFDHMVNNSMLKIKYKAISMFVTDRCESTMQQDILQAINITVDSTLTANRGHIIVRHKTHVSRVIINNGLLSGWRLTAYLGTMSNYAKVIAFRIVVVLRTSERYDPAADPINDFTSQGDDLRSRVKSLLHGKCFSMLYQEAGFQVHPRKYFISSHADEFLRKVALYGEKLIGYPARGVSVLVFRNPAKSDMLQGEMRIREMVASWMVVVRRSGNFSSKIRAMITRDVARANAVSKASVSAFMHAPTSFGGMGIQPYQFKQVTITNATYGKDPVLADSPLALGLAGTEHVEELKKVWAAGIKWLIPKRVIKNMTIKVNDIKKMPAVKPLLSAAQPMIERSQWVTGPIPKPTKTPSMTEVYKRKTLSCNRKDMLTSAALWMDTASLSILCKYLNSMDIRLVKDWINGNLVGSPPESHQQAPVYMSTTYKNLVTSNIARICQQSRVTYSMIQRAQWQAEVMTNTLSTLNQFKFLD